MSDTPSSLPGCVGPTPPPDEPVYQQLLSVSDQLRDASQLLVDVVHQQLQGQLQSVDLIVAQVHQLVCAELAVVEGEYATVAATVADRVLGRLGLAAGTLAAVGIDMPDAAELQSRAASLPSPGAGLPPVPAPPDVHITRLPPRVQLGSGLGAPWGVPELPKTPEWVGEATERLMPMPAQAVSGGYTPFGTAATVEGFAAPPTQPAPAAQKTTRATTGTEAVAAPGMRQPSQDASAGMPGVVRPAPILVTAEGGRVSAEGAGGAGRSGLGLSGVGDQGGLAETAWAGRGDGGLPGVDASVARRNSQDTVLGEGLPCPTVHVHVTCEKGAPAAPAAAPGDVFLIGAEADAAPTNGATPAGVPQPVPERPLRRPAPDPFMMGQRAQGEPPPPAAALAGAAFDNVVQQWITAAAEFVRDPVNPQTCYKPATKGGDAKGVLEAVWLWLTGTKDGRGWDSAAGLPYALKQLPPLVREGAEFLLRGVIGVVRTQLSIDEAILGCSDPAALPIILMRAVVGVVEKWTGAPLPEAQTKLAQAAGLLCAAGVPGVAEAHAAYLTGKIDIDSWRCLVRANGQIDHWQQNVMESLQTVPSPLQITNIWQRWGGTDDELKRMLRYSSVIEPLWREGYKELAKYLPAPGDLVSFMLRDVFDEGVVAKYGYDEDLEKKFTGQAQVWGRSQGMTIDQMRYYWRAHWRLPSPTQGYAMAHRLRPGRVPADVETTVPDIEQLLQVNDYPEYWRKRLVALSYHPLTRVDLRRAYFIGAVSEEETLNGILDLGYNERDAKVLLRYWQQERVNWASNQPWAKAYVRGELSDAELHERLGRMNLTAGQTDQLEQELDLRSEALRKRGIVAGLKKRVTSGLATPEGAAAELESLGYSRARAARLTGAWYDERLSRSRVLTAAELCKMYDLGILTPAEYTQALQRLGYGLSDVKRVVALCESSKGMTPTDWGAPAEGASERAQALQREAERKAIYRKNMEIARAARQRRNLGLNEEKVIKRLSAVASALAKKLGGEVDEYGLRLRKLHGYMTEQLCYTRLGAADLISEVVKPMAQAKDAGWENAARQYIDSLPARPCPAPDREMAEGAEPAGAPQQEGLTDLPPG